MSANMQGRVKVTELINLSNGEDQEDSVWYDRRMSIGRLLQQIGNDVPNWTSVVITITRQAYERKD